MSALSLRIARGIAIARHVPLARLTRRGALEFKRRVLERAAPYVAMESSQQWDCAATLPGPVFPPRTGKCTRIADGWRFTFLERTCDTSRVIDWRSGGAGAQHQLWRMNLHYMEYLEDVCDADLAELVSQWIDANPPFARGYWHDSWNSYTISLRTVVWMQQFAVRANGLESALKSKMLTSLAQQIEFLAHNLETDIGGNHLMKNIKALVWAGAFFTGQRPRQLQELALRLLNRELETQVLRDGVHYERSPSYHAQVFADLLEIRHALGRDPFSGRLDAALSSMSQAVADLAHPDGGPAQFNDAGLTMCYAPGTCLDACERVLGRRALPRPVFAFADAGYFGMRANGTYVVADCGAIAPDDLPAHGHGDVLSFECSLAGERMIVDQGVYQYFAGDKRQASRASASHNTLCVDGTDQADFYGSFRCGRRPGVKVLRHELRDDGFLLEGCHDGFAHLPGHPIHTRCMTVTAAGMEILDQISAACGKAVRIGFLLHPACSAVHEGGAIRVMRGTAGIRISSDRNLAIADAVWWPDMGVEQATHRVVISVPQGETSVRCTLEFTH